MQKIKILLSFLLVLLGLVYGLQARAASTLESSGRILISMQKTDSIAVQGLADIQLSAQQLSKGSQRHDICIFSSNKLYGVSINSRNGGDGSYHLSDGKQQIGYRVSWSDGDGYVGLAEESKSFANASMLPCDKQSNASLNIDIKPESLALAQRGNFSDTLTLVFEPK